MFGPPLGIRSNTDKQKVVQIVTENQKRSLSEIFVKYEEGKPTV
jgi:hypothetical protein